MFMQNKAISEILVNSFDERSAADFADSIKHLTIQVRGEFAQFLINFELVI